MVNLSFTCYFNKSCKHKNIPCASVTAGSLISKASLLLLIAFAYTADAKHDTISADISSTWLGDSGIFPTFYCLGKWWDKVSFVPPVNPLRCCNQNEEEEGCVVPKRAAGEGQNWKRKRDKIQNSLQRLTPT